jgi:putative two-component system response regulator
MMTLSRPSSGAFDAVDDLLMALARDAEARDPFTGGHCRRLAGYAVALGVALQLPDADLITLHRGSFLHDVGKIAIPGDLLLKPDQLTDAEYDVVKRHTLIGDTLCAGRDALRTVRPIVRSHHERADGSGYPDGLSERRIPLLAQIVGLVDSFDALTTARPYHPARSTEAACDTLIGEARRGWRSAALVEEFVALARSKRLERLRREAEGVVRES